MLPRHLLAGPLACLLAACTPAAAPVPLAVAKAPFHLNDYEQRFGYAQAVRSRGQLHIAATYAVDGQGRLMAPGDLASQLDAVYANLARTLRAHGAGFDDVLVERVYVTDMPAFLAISDRRLARYAVDALPALTLVEVRRLVDPGFLIAIEAVAEVAESPGAAASSDRDADRTASGR